MKFDSQGRIHLGKKLCEEFNFQVGEQVDLIYEDERTYRLAKKDQIKSEDKVVWPNLLLEEKYRILIPIDIRQMHPNIVMIYGQKQMQVCIWFLKESKKSTEEKLLLAIERLADAVEKLCEKL